MFALFVRILVGDQLQEWRFEGFVDADKISSTIVTIREENGDGSYHVVPMPPFGSPMMGVGDADYDPRRINENPHQ